MSWSVLLRDEKLPLPSATLCPLLQEALGGLVIDYHHTIQTQHGWLARGVEQPAAELLVALLEERGHPAIAKRDEELLDLDRRFVVTNGSVQEDALHFQESLAGSQRVVPWERLAVVAIGSVPMTREKAVKTRTETRGLNKAVLLTTGIPIQQKKTVLKTNFETVKTEGILVHLVLLEEPSLVLEIRPTRFDYHYLGERKAKGPAENFRLFLGDLAGCSGAAHWTDMALRFLEKGVLQPEFADEKDFLRFTRWITAKSVG